MTDATRKRRHRVAPVITQRARRLRKKATFPERLIWSRLRGSRLGGVRFRRQHPVGPYIVDFYCARAKLAIELDCLSHEETEQYDCSRTRYLQSLGIRVIRFTNDEVVRDVEDVIFRIACEVGLDP
jgi:very-short-patch-repair endonuclease